MEKTRGLNHTFRRFHAGKSFAPFLAAKILKFKLTLILLPAFFAAFFAAPNAFAYGAVAGFDAPFASAYVLRNVPTEARARTEALSTCQGFAGGSTCEILTTFINECVHVVSPFPSQTSNFIGKGATPAAALTDAHSKCGTGCDNSSSQISDARQFHEETGYKGCDSTCFGDMVFSAGACNCPFGEVPNLDTTTNANDCEPIRDCGSVEPSLNTATNKCTVCPADTELNPNDNTKCRPTAAHICGNQVFDNRACRDALPSDCSGAGNENKIPVVSAGVVACTTCPTGRKAGDGLTCGASMPSDCHDPNRPEQIYDPALSNCRDAVKEDCPETDEIVSLAGGTFTCEECSGNTPVVHDNGFNCRAFTGLDCTNGEILEDAAAQSCRSLRREDCTETNEIPTNRFGELACVACPGLQIKDNDDGLSCHCGSSMVLQESLNDKCRPPQESDCPVGGEIPVMIIKGVVTCGTCTGATPIVHENGVSCRARIAADCDDEVFDTVSKECRTNILPGDCPADKSVPTETVSNGVVDCMACGALEIEDSDGITCRAVNAPADCGDMVFDDNALGKCRAVEETDCAADGQIPTVAAGVVSCTDCAATEVEDSGGLMCNERVAADCGNMVFDTGTKLCRAAQTNDCPANGQIPGTITDGVAACDTCGAMQIEESDGLMCRDLEKNDCPDNGQIPAVTAGVLSCEPCPGAMPVEHDNGLSCRERVAEDCGAEVFQTSNKTCRPARANDCSNPNQYPAVANGVLTCTTCPNGAPKSTDGLSCRPLTVADCNERIFDNGMCRAARAEDCPANGQIPAVAAGVVSCTACTGAMPLEHDNGLSCRERVAEDCGAEVFQTSNKTCRPVRADDCSNPNQYPAVANGVLTCTTCPNGIPKSTDGLSCRARTVADCNERIFDNGNCRAARADDCPGNRQFPAVAAGILSCTNCAATEVKNSDGLSCRARIAADCENTVFDAGLCRPARADDCPAAGEIPAVAAGIINCEACNDTLTGGVANRAGSACICPGGMERFSNANNNICAVSLPVEKYSIADCEGANWTAVLEIDSGNRVRQLCDIPILVSVITSSPGALRQAAAVAPLQTAAGEHDGCILREHDGFSGGSFPECHDEGLFGLLPGLPIQTPAFAAARTLASPASPPRLVVAVDADGLAMLAPTFEGQTVRLFTPSGGGGSDISGGQAIGIGMAAFVGMVAYGIWDGNLAAFSLSPQTYFSYNGGAAAYSYGSRLDFRQDKLTAYWAASQSRSGGKTNLWRYSTGLKYGGDFWHLGFDNINYGSVAEIDIFLATKWKAGIWRLESGLNANIRLDALEEDKAAVYWTMAGALNYHRWEIRPSLNLYWREGESFGEDARIRINLRREF